MIATITYPTFESESQIAAAIKKGMIYALHLCNYNDSVHTAYLCDSIEVARSIYKQKSANFEMYRFDKNGEEIKSGWIK